MPNAAAEIFLQAAESNRQDPRRRGCVVCIEDDADVIVTGDIHGRRASLTKILSHASLDRSPRRRLVLQEIIHGPTDPLTGHDRSVDLLLRAARARLAHPLGVLFVLGNHDLAQAGGGEITKAGVGACEAFSAGVSYAFGHDGEEVLRAIDEFLLSAPLAIRCPNGVLIAHSLPSPGRWRSLPDWPYRPEDLHRGGAVYEWTWGRAHTAADIEAMAGELDARFFVLGHMYLDTGYELLSPRAVALASDHPHGAILQFAAGAELNAENVSAHVRPIVALNAGPAGPTG